MNNPRKINPRPATHPLKVGCRMESSKTGEFVEIRLLISITPETIASTPTG